MSGWRAGLACVGGLALLLGAFWLGRISTEPAGAPAPPTRESAAQGADALGAELAAERERSRELAAQLSWLQAQIARVGLEEEAPGVGSPDASPGEAGSAQATPAEAPGRWFDADELRDLGLPEGDVARLQTVFNEYEMKRIDLVHQAEREGWANQRRFWDEMVQFQLGMREEIGDESYDVMLYATGRKNRVVMSELLGGSPAESYGFEQGDVVIGYEGQRIFHGRELRRATAQGERGDWVTVDVLRDGEPVRVRAQRGPLGVKLQPARILPESLW